LYRANYKLLHSRNLFLRHEFAQSANRVSKYKFNWYSICKNTAYLTLRFATGSKSLAIEEVRKRISHDRIGYLREGLDNDQISLSDFEHMVGEVWRGFDDGLARAKTERKLGNFAKPPPMFLPFVEGAKTNQALHVLLVTKEFPPFTQSGGVGTLYYHLASELLLLGHRVTVICRGEQASAHLRGRFSLYALPPVRATQQRFDNALCDDLAEWSVQVAKKAIEIHQRDPLSVVDASLWDVETFGFAALPRSERPPVVTRLVTPFLVASMSNEWTFDTSTLKLVSGMERRVVERSDAVVPISRSIADTFGHLYGVSHDGRWHEIPAGIAPWPAYDVGTGYGDLDSLPGIGPAKMSGKLIVTYLGRLERRKGVDLFAAALAKLPSSTRAKCVFLVAGNGDESLLSAHGIDIPRSPEVMRIKDVPDWMRDKIYSASDIVVFPSRYESFGLVPLEAFVHSVPVIAGNAGGIPEVIEEGRSGLLFEPGDADDLCAKLITLIENDDLRKTLSQGASQRVHQLSARKMAKQSIELYRTLSASA
jgi:glycosyltransferase involved in cell wall biosynthesis